MPDESQGTHKEVLECHASKFRSERVGGKLQRCWEWLGRYRWRAAHPRQSSVLPKIQPVKDTMPRHVITLSEEEVFDVSLATFYVLDKEEAGTHPPGIQLAAHGHGGCGGTWVWLRTRRR